MRLRLLLQGLAAIAISSIWATAAPTVSAPDAIGLAESYLNSKKLPFTTTEFFRLERAEADFASAFKVDWILTYKASYQNLDGFLYVRVSRDRSASHDLGFWRLSVTFDKEQYAHGEKPLMTVKVENTGPEASRLNVGRLLGDYHVLVARAGRIIPISSQAIAAAGDAGAMGTMIDPGAGVNDSIDLSTAVREAGSLSPGKYAVSIKRKGRPRSTYYVEPSAFGAAYGNFTVTEK